MSETAGCSGQSVQPTRMDRMSANRNRRSKIIPLLSIALRWLIGPRKTSHRSGMRFGAFGIAAGIVALITTMSVMNGLQKQYIDSLLETTSFHVRVSVDPSTVETLTRTLRANRLVRSVTPFHETNLLASGGSAGRQNIVRVMWIDPQDLVQDLGFCSALHLSPTYAKKSLTDGILIGSEVAHILGAYDGSLLTLRGAFISPEEGIQQYSIETPISGLFKSGYYELDAGLAILDPHRFGNSQIMAQPISLGIKLHDPNRAAEFTEELTHQKGVQRAESWNEYNRSFFSALRTEKIVMFLLVSIIFAVVAINIHYSMRRSIARKAKDLAILAAFGVSKKAISAIFTLEGILIGATGALMGIAIGIPVARNVDAIINAAIGIIESLLSLLHRIGLTGNVPDLRIFSPSVFYIDGIPSHIMSSDIAIIAIFAIIFPAIAVRLAYRRYKTASPLEVLRSE